MKKMSMNVTRILNGTNTDTPAQEIEVTEIGKTWESVRNKCMNSIKKQLRKFKNTGGYFEANIDVYAADENEQNAEQNHFVQTLSMQF
jgi:hypothetical protein